MIPNLDVDTIDEGDSECNSFSDPIKHRLHSSDHDGPIDWIESRHALAKCRSFDKKAQSFPSIALCIGRSYLISCVYRVHLPDNICTISQHHRNSHTSWQLLVWMPSVTVHFINNQNKSPIYIQVHSGGTTDPHLKKTALFRVALVLIQVHGQLYPT